MRAGRPRRVAHQDGAAQAGGRAGRPSAPRRDARRRRRARGVDGRGVLGQPGPGGWAWATQDGRQDSGGEAATTNQRMEIRAALEAVRALPGPLVGRQRLDLRRQLLPRRLVARAGSRVAGRRARRSRWSAATWGAADHAGERAWRRVVPLGEGPLGRPDERPGRRAGRGAVARVGLRRWSFRSSPRRPPDLRAESATSQTRKLLRRRLHLCEVRERGGGAEPPSRSWQPRCRPTPSRPVGRDVTDTRHAAEVAGSPSTAGGELRDVPAPARTGCSAASRSCARRSRRRPPRCRTSDLPVRWWSARRPSSRRGPTRSRARPQTPTWSRIGDALGAERLAELRPCRCRRPRWGR